MATSITKIPSIFPISDHAQRCHQKVHDFIQAEIAPNESLYVDQMANAPDRWDFTPPILEELKDRAKAANLWNLFLPESDHGFGLSNLEYAPLAEMMGQHPISSEVFNSSAPDTGNMEVLERYGSEEHKETWLKPLLDGRIRSAFAMTEPGVASSDATNISLSAVRDGDHYVLNGQKWWTSGAGDPRCKILIVMCVTNPDAPKHQRQSQILVPLDTEGLKVERMMHVFGYDDAPHGHGHLTFTDVRVPVSNLILGEGRGFEIAQGRLGPGRIHHCMRCIGVAEKALEYMCKRASSRVAFGKPLAQLGGNFDVIADARISIEMARLLTLKAAHMMDTVGNKLAASEIAQIKVAAPNLALQIIDDAIQMHGAAGVSQDFPLARMYASMRTLRLADGPDEVHRRTVARHEIGKYNA
ncbi:MAG: acyl-CoA dehydrogenase family protein [Gammaproteobacteria bacterium]